MKGIIIPQVDLELGVWSLWDRRHPLLKSTQWIVRNPEVTHLGPSLCFGSFELTMLLPASPPSFSSELPSPFGWGRGPERRVSEDLSLLPIAVELAYVSLTLGSVWKVLSSSRVSLRAWGLGVAGCDPDCCLPVPGLQASASMAGWSPSWLALLRTRRWW